MAAKHPRVIHYTDGVRAQCPGAAPHPIPLGVDPLTCPTHPDARTVVVALVDAVTPPDPRWCICCGMTSMQDGRTHRCPDCAELTDRAWASLLTDPTPPPWQGCGDVLHLAGGYGIDYGPPQ